MRSLMCVGFAGLVASAASAQAWVLAEWTFEGDPSPITNFTAADVNALTLPTVVGAVPAQAGRVVASAAIGVGINNTAVTVAAPTIQSQTGNGSARALSVNSWDIGEFFQISLDTTGFTDIGITWDQTGGNASVPPTWDLTYSINGGSSFSTLINNFTVLGSGSAQPPPSSWSSNPANRRTQYTYSNLLPADAANVPNLLIRIVADSAPGGGNPPTVSSRIDNVIVTGVPEPTTLALLAVGAAAVMRRRK